jgi:hypothetical protein
MSAMLHRLLRRFGFGGQASRPAQRRPQVRLSLEALDDRIMPYASLFTTAVVPTSNPFASYIGNLQTMPFVSAVPAYSPVPDLTGTAQNMHMGSTIDLGLGTLKVSSEYVDPQTGNMRFTGYFTSRAQLVFPLGIQVSDNIGPIQVTGEIYRFSTSSGTALFNGSMVSYYTNSISFSAFGDGPVGSARLPDQQQVSFTGSILSVWGPNGALPVGVSGSIDIKDTVANLLNGNMPGQFDTGLTPVPGMNWIGTNWAAINYLQ